MLPLLAVDQRPQVERVRVVISSGGDDPRPERSMCVERLAERHRRRAPLPVAHADVIDDHVTRDDFMRAGARHMTASLADDDTELALVVERLETRGR